MIKSALSYYTEVIGVVIGCAVMFSNRNAYADINCAQSTDACCCAQYMGNINCSADNAADIGDLQEFIRYLFVDFLPVPSPTQANLDRDTLGIIDVGDLTELIDHLFITMKPLPYCPGYVNHPPMTILGDFPRRDSAYVFPVTSPDDPRWRLFANWMGVDPYDNQGQVFNLRYEWRVYGPYDEATLTALISTCVRGVFCTPDGCVYRLDEHAKIVRCDTSVTPDGIEISCDTLSIDSLGSAWNGLPDSSIGYFDTKLLVEDSAFAANPAYNKIALSYVADAPTTVTAASIGNLLCFIPGDSTVERKFIFWVRSIDNDDATMADPVPPFRTFSMIRAGFERDILLVWGNHPFTISVSKKDSVRAFWQSATERWLPGATFDYINPAGPTGTTLPLRELLRHKVVVLHSDDVIPGILVMESLRRTLHTAQLKGIGFWLCGRAQSSGGEDKSPSVYSRKGTDDEVYFGKSELYYTGWEWCANGYHFDPAIRIEDFVGAKSTGLAGWPDLAIDTHFVHSRYSWTNYPWIPTLACLPEVGQTVPVPESEILYTYESRYGDDFPYDSITPNLHGGPVAYRLDRGGYRVVVSNFSPVAITSDADAAQVFVDSALSWLYNPALNSNNVPEYQRSNSTLLPVKVGASGLSPRP